jgi:glyoxylase-like metal-dependent hydrolase (beta-lactamase superfamily II)
LSIGFVVGNTWFMSQLLTFTGGFAATNGYVLEAPGGWVVVDAPPGMGEFLRERGVEVAALLLTHSHLDHVMDAAEVAAGGCAVYAWGESTPEDRLEPLFAQWTGTAVRVPPYGVSHPLMEELGRVVDVAGMRVRVAHVPGHSEDSLVYVVPELGVVFSGDTLMAGGVGRSDFPGGSHERLVAGIRREILGLPGAMVIYPGHGPATTVGAEARSNPYLAGGRLG